MRFIYILLLIVIAHRTSAQSYDKITALNTYKVTVNYPDHAATAIIKPVKATPAPDADKFYYWYSGGRIHVTQGGFSGKLLNGLYTDYYLNKNLKEQGEFKKGLKGGEWKAWYENGFLKEQASWRSGKRNGPFSRYDSLGKVAEKGRYRAGLLHGKVITYSGKDSVSVLHYRKGKVFIPKKIKVLNQFTKLKFLKKGKRKDKGIKKEQE